MCVMMQNRVFFSAAIIYFVSTDSAVRLARNQRVTYPPLSVVISPPTSARNFKSRTKSLGFSLSTTANEHQRSDISQAQTRFLFLPDTHVQYIQRNMHTVFCFAVLCCGYTLTDFPISIRLTSLALWQSNDCPSASKATLMNMDKYFMWIHYELLHNHNKAKHNKTVCIFLEIYCTLYFSYT